MADTCTAQGCQRSSKCACLCNFDLKMCEIHLTEHLKLGESHKPVLTLAERKKIDEIFHQEMSNLFSVSTKALVKGKQMFQGICNKLCEITDVLSQKQQALIELRSQSSFYADIEENIRKLSQTGLKFRSKESFQKVLEKHLSESDDSMDLSLFVEKFDEINQRLDVNNGYLQLVSDKNAREREELDAKLENIMKERLLKEREFEKNMVEMSTKLEKCVECDQVKTLKEQTHILELEIKKLKTTLDQNSLAMSIGKKVNQDQAKKFETQGKMLTELCKNNLEIFLNKCSQLKEQVEESICSSNDLISKNNDLLSSQIEKNEKSSEEKIKNLSALLISKIESINTNFETKFNENCSVLANSNSKLTDKIDQCNSEVVSLVRKYDEHIENFTKISTDANLELSKVSDKCKDIEIAISSKAGNNDIMLCKGFVEMFAECFRDFNKFIRCVKFSNNEGMIFICINNFRSYMINSS